MYTCTVSNSDCGKVADAVDNIRIAANSEHVLSNSERAELKTLLALLGNSTQKKGVNIGAGSLDKGTHGQAETSGKDTNITLDMGQIAAEGHGSSLVASIVLSGVVAHETTHGYDSQNGHPLVNTLSGRIAHEAHAFSVQANVLRAFDYFDGAKKFAIGVWVDVSAHKDSAQSCKADDNCEWK